MEDDDFPEVIDDGGAIAPPSLSSAPMVECQLDEEIVPIVGDDGPYLVYQATRTFLLSAWNPKYDENALCKCGHIYYRHFDTWEQMYPCGCKYCQCRVFQPISD